MTDESLLAATSAALDAAVVECRWLRRERDRARDGLRHFAAFGCTTTDDPCGIVTT